jgi:hypothetical protein
MLFSLQRVVDGARVDNLTIVIMEALQKGGLNPTFVFQKLFCFGVNGVSTFQGTKIGVIKQISTNYAPFSIGVHYIAHRCNLAFKTLSTLGIVSSIENLLQSCYVYFVHSQKRHLEFTKLIRMMKWFKMLKNAETHWIFLMDLLRIHATFGQMAMDSSSNQATKVPCFNLFFNVY